MKISSIKYTLLMAAVSLLTACSDVVDYDDNYTREDKVANAAAPSITAVYAVGDTAMATPITLGERNELVRITGKNLNNVKKITFNTVEADLSEVYTYSDGAVVRIPKQLSTEQVNKIEYTTDKGSTTFDFTVNFPSLSITGPVNEFANAGSNEILLGQNFDLYDIKATVGGADCKVTTLSSDSLAITIPEGTADNSKLLLSWTDNKGQAASQSYVFRPTSHLLYGNLDDASLSSGGLTAAVESDDATATASKLGNNHLHFTGTYSAWSWNTYDISRNMVDVGDMSNLDDYVLRFEVLTTSSAPLTGDFQLRFQINWGSDYTWNPAQTINTHGQWKTISLPLKDMASNGISAAGSWQTLRLVLQPKTSYTADFCIGNIRIEKRY